ncbi:hypothetical protein CDAR_402241 [Caerostris darwini]|uniref:Uncharacterized protein n=1 Tax=Caerostris darwini TaxID=1538125 RepID=A0AAV4T1I5_9ARAC|nr:hypothetical protein CDAR_402241 [Caerostris darwini]
MHIPHPYGYGINPYSMRLSIGAIVGIVVTVLMGIFIIMMFAFFFFPQKASCKCSSLMKLYPKGINFKAQMDLMSK